MTLRTRLLVGVFGVAVVLALLGISITVTQRSQFYNQLDGQLEAIENVISQLDDRPPVERPGDSNSILGNTYIGVVSPDGNLLPIATPIDDPELVPAIPNGQGLDSPTTLGTVSGDADHVRASTVVVNGQLVLFALPTTEADESLRSLIIAEATAGAIILFSLALFVWWMIRHGLRPIRKMTEAADAIAAGAVDRRVEQPTGRTEAARLGRALNLMIDRTQEAEAQRSRFTADVSHELRTPLTTLQGYAALYQQGALEEPGALDDAMRRVSDEAGRMKRTVEQLLTLSDLDERRPPNREALVIHDLLSDIAADIHAAQPERVVTVSADSDVIAHANGDQLFQALTALASNAMRYTSADSPIELDATAIRERVRIEVRDHGPGISASDVPHVFERLYRSDKGRARTTGGNGLGLAIVAAIADAHNGTRGVHPTPGGGATIWIELPSVDVR
ncbi:sensor histidine kinase [uncultured Ilumatobacter sp.]|uniref:sensor histidine kinase n=1 Tax=uncultured Ilumatobacter sp. TaxID=879968 RepID=UPI00374F9637